MSVGCLAWKRSKRKIHTFVVDQERRAKREMHDGVQIFSVKRRFEGWRKEAGLVRVRKDVNEDNSR